jgi:hypothetical protein
MSALVRPVKAPSKTVGSLAGTLDCDACRMRCETTDMRSTEDCQAPGVRPTRSFAADRGTHAESSNTIIHGGGWRRGCVARLGAFRLVRAARQLVWREHPARGGAPVHYKGRQLRPAAFAVTRRTCHKQRAISIVSRKRDDGLHAMIENTPPRFLNSRPHVGGHSC